MWSKRSGVFFSLGKTSFSCRLIGHVSASVEKASYEWSMYRVKGVSRSLAKVPGDHTEPQCFQIRQLMQQTVPLLSIGRQACRTLIIQVKSRFSRSWAGQGLLRRELEELSRRTSSHIVMVVCSFFRHESHITIIGIDFCQVSWNFIDFAWYTERQGVSGYQSANVLNAC